MHGYCMAFLVGTYRYLVLQPMTRRIALRLKQCGVVVARLEMFGRLTELVVEGRIKSVGFLSDASYQ